MSDEIEKLDGEDSAILNKRGWYMVTYYQSKKSDDSSKAYDHAVEKAASIQRQTGIRTVDKQEHTVFEIWEYWK